MISPGLVETGFIQKMMGDAEAANEFFSQNEVGVHFSLIRKLPDVN